MESTSWGYGFNTGRCWAFFFFFFITFSTFPNQRFIYMCQLSMDGFRSLAVTGPLIGPVRSGTALFVFLAVTGPFVDRSGLLVGTVGQKLSIVIVKSSKHVQCKPDLFTFYVMPSLFQFTLGQRLFCKNTRDRFRTFLPGTRWWAASRRRPPRWRWSRATCACPGCTGTRSRWRTWSRSTAGTSQPWSGMATGWGLTGPGRTGTGRRVTDL